MIRPEDWNVSIEQDPHTDWGDRVITVSPVEWAELIREAQARAWDMGHRACACQRPGASQCQNPYRSAR